MDKIKYLILNITILSFLYSSEFILPRFEKPPLIDGIIEKEWENALVFKDFKELFPDEGSIPEVETEVYVGYDKNNLYVAFKCFDDVNTIRKTLTKRDEFVMEDRVFVYLDPYGREREGFVFGTNPVSVQFDAFKFPPPGNEEDWDFDTNWEVKSCIKDKFWSAEFKIPFSSLRFEVKESQKWNIIFLRIRPRESMAIYSFPPLLRSNPGFFSQGIKIIIPEKIYTRVRRSELIPYLISFQSSEKDTAGKYFNKGFNYDLGLNLKYRLLENLVFDLALNPDFAQVETDIPQIDFNRVEALYYPEKRPLFMEGSSLISFPIDIFYTRTINNPFYSFKLTGRYKFFDLYLLSAYDENSLFIVPFEDGSISFPSDKKSFSNFLRFRSDFLNKQSFIGFTFSNRMLKNDSFDNGYNTLVSLDMHLRFLKNYTLEYQGVYSLTREPSDSFLYNDFDGEKFYGFANNFKFNFNSKNLMFVSSYQDLSPNFRSDLGFISKNNYRRITFRIAPIFYPIKYKINQIFSSIYWSREYNYEGILKREEMGIRPKVNFPFKNLDLGFNFKRKYRFYSGKEFKNMDETNFNISGVPFKWLNLTTFLGFGEEVYYMELKIIYTLNYSFNLNFLLPKIQFGFGYEKAHYSFKRFKEEFFTESVLNFTFNYSFTEHLSSRIILTGNINKGFPSLYGFYPLISYELTPFTVFYLGANINVIKHPFKIEGQNHQIFLKFQYTFNM